jgi:hypothetical protein
MARKRITIKGPEVRQKSLPAYWTWMALAAILIFTAAVRFRLLEFPLERDEGEYAYMGQLILQGIPPYESAYNMKFPGTYAGYALIMSVFGQTIAGIHLGILLLNAAAIAMVFLIGKRVYNAPAGLMAAATYAVLTMSQGSLGLAGHATHFVILPALGAAFLMLKLRENPRPWRILVIGLLLGLAVLMKQPGVFFIPMVWLYMVWLWSRANPRRISQLLGQSALLLAGVAVPLAIAAIILIKAGVFERFWYWTIVYARSYGTLVPLRYVPQVFDVGFGVVCQHTWLIWLSAAISLVWLIARPATRRLAGFLAFFFVLSFMAVCPGFYFRQHYFILVMPAVALLVGAGISSLREILRPIGLEGSMLLTLGLFAIVIGYPLWLESDFLFRMTPDEACQLTYGPNPFVEAKEVAAYVKSKTTPDQKIAVIGSEPEIYFYANRHSATGYIYMYPLMERQSNARAMQEEMIRQIEAEKPPYMVVVNVSVSWLVTKDSDMRLLDWYKRYARGYEIVGVADILPEGTIYKWGADAEAQPQKTNTVQVLKRR